MTGVCLQIVRVQFCTKKTFGEKINFKKPFKSYFLSYVYLMKLNPIFMVSTFSTVLGEILGVLLRILFQNKLDHRSLAYFQRQLPDLVPRSLFAQIDDSILSGGAELKRLQEQVASL